MLIASIAVLSLFDIVATGVGVSRGLIREGNPLVIHLFEQSIVGTCILIAVVVASALWLVSRYVDCYRWIRYALGVVLLVKIGIASMHLFWISVLLHV